MIIWKEASENKILEKTINIFWGDKINVIYKKPIEVLKKFYSEFTDVNCRICLLKIESLGDDLRKFRTPLK